jgi:hypothetical protein
MSLFASFLLVISLVLLGTSVSTFRVLQASSFYRDFLLFVNRLVRCSHNFVQTVVIMAVLRIPPALSLPLLSVISHLRNLLTMLEKSYIGHQFFPKERGTLLDPFRAMPSHRVVYSVSCAFTPFRHVAVILSFSSSAVIINRVVPILFFS